MQDLAWIISLILIAAVAAVFLWITACASTACGDAAAMARSAYRVRDRLFWLALTAGAAISFASLLEWPIAGHAAASARPDAVIRAVGHQWRWALERDTVKVGELIEFEVTAEDVNHGFAIYRDKFRLIAQAQAMPGYVNRLRVRFAEPGEYEVLCLEYCGVAHHGMRAIIKVHAGS